MKHVAIANGPLKLKCACGEPGKVCTTFGVNEHVLCDLCFRRDALDLSLNQLRQLELLAKSKRHYASSSHVRFK